MSNQNSGLFLGHPVQLSLPGQPYENPCSYCTDHIEDALSMSDITDIDDVSTSATGLQNTFSNDVIDDAGLSSPRDSVSCDLSRYGVSLHLHRVFVKTGSVTAINQQTCSRLQRINLVLQIPNIYDIFYDR